MLTLWTPKDGEKDPNKTYYTHGLHASRCAVFNIHPDEFTKRYDAYRNSRAMIQDAFPELNADEREYMLTGITPAEWDVLFNDRDED